MKSPGRAPSSCGFPRRAASIWAAACGLAAGACITSYWLDCRGLREIAAGVTAAAVSDSEKVVSLAKWVQSIEGTRENQDYFVIRKWRAPPMQVVQKGGDCADKSRLLWALLREIGIPSTMVMCFHRETRQPTHTVVEARIGADRYMVVDPVYGLYFPKGGGEYFDLRDLRQDPEIVDQRVVELRTTAPPTSPVWSYDAVSAAYDGATSINWDKNSLTHLVYAMAKAWYGEDVYRIQRPRILEEPKLSAAAALLILGAFPLVALSCQLRWRVRRWSAPRTEVLVPCGL